MNTNQTPAGGTVAGLSVAGGSAPSRAGRVFRWAVYNLGALAIAWFALVENLTWANNLLSSVTVAYALIALGAFSKDVQKACQKHGRSVPAWLSVSLDMAIMLGCAATGSFWLAAAWLWIMMSEQVLYALPNKQGEPCGPKAAPVGDPAK